MEKNTNGPIASLLIAIEELLEWGKSSQWSSYDFDKLAELVHERTDVMISSNTLKRIWGRIKYESNPSETTLNTLSQFLGFADFREFKNLNNSKKSWKAIHKKLNKLKRPNLKSRPYLIFTSGAVCMLVTLLALSYSKKEEKLNPDDFYFASRKVTKGLPNSVIFGYNAKNAPSGAKIEIQQSWDIRKRHTLSKRDTLITSIYHDPGYFKAKLVINDQVVKEHGLLISSDGWKGKFENEDRTVYLSENSLTRSNTIALDSELLKEYDFSLNDPKLAMTFRYVDDFKDLRVSDLFLETQLRNIIASGLNACQKTSITLLMEGEAITIPISNKGCVADLKIWHLNQNIKGSNNDLSKLGVDFENWITVRCVIKNDWLVFYIDDIKALQLSMKGRTNKFHGLIYHFEGSGEIKSLSLKNSEKTYLTWPQVETFM